MKITVRLEDAEWQARMIALVPAMDEAGRDASLKGAEAIRDVAKTGLEAHPHSELTYSPTSPGDYPGRVSGDLADSMDAAMVGDQAWVGPTGLDYARIQELGGPMPTSSPGPMRFRKLDGWHELTFVDLKARPYLAPATEDVIDTGLLTEIYVDEWADTIREIVA